MACKAACRLLLLKEKLTDVSIITPKGFIASAPVIYSKNPANSAKSVRCGVKKDAGDDADATNGIEIFATVSVIEHNGENSSGVKVIIDGGQGVGRVTKDGLDQAVGEAAINSTPRKMIEKEALSACFEAHFSGTLKVVIDIPRGEEIAKKTFNEHLGITGGISVIGTTGVVEPMSVEALIGAIEAELNVAFAAVREKTVRPLIITPGEYGDFFLKNNFSHILQSVSVVKCSNYIGDTLDRAVNKGFSHLFIIGHAGKIAKIAGGIFNTHSSVADCRAEIFASHAALSGASTSVVQKIMNAATVDAMLDILQNESQELYDSTLQSISEKIAYHLARRIGENTAFAYLSFTHQHGTLFSSDNLASFLETLKNFELLQKTY